MESEPIKIHYWNLRGISGYVFSLCEFTNTPYEWIKENDMEKWLASKDDLAKQGLKIPNLPWIEDGDTKLSESLAILNYIAEKAGHKDMIPAQQNLTTFLMYEGVILDLHKHFGYMAYSHKTMEEFKAAYENSGRFFFKLVHLNNHLGSSPWILGDKISILDFLFADNLERYLDIEKDLGLEIISKHENLQAYLKKYWALDKIKAYRESDRFVARPYHAPFAVWK